MALPNIIQQINSKLPLSGGNMSGNIVFNTGVLSQTASANEIILFASADKTTPSSKSCLAIRNENHASEPGSFYIRSCHDTNSSVMKIMPNGTFTWRGNNVITSAGGTINGTLSINGNIGVTGEINSTSGNIVATNGVVQGVRLKANNNVNDNIDFMFRHISDGGAYLPGVHARAGEWQMIPTIRSAWTSGASGCRIWNDGFIEQWGQVSINEGTTIIVNLHTPMATQGYHITVTNASGKTSHNAEGVINAHSHQTTSFSMSCGYIDPNTSLVMWAVFGY